MTKEEIFNIADAHFQARQKNHIFAVGNLDFCRFLIPAIVPHADGTVIVKAGVIHEVELRFTDSSIQTLRPE